MGTKQEDTEQAPECSVMDKHRLDIGSARGSGGWMDGWMDVKTRSGWESGQEKGAASTTTRLTLAQIKRLCMVVEVSSEVGYEQ